MSVARITEISCSSAKSFDDAVSTGVERAAETLDNITSAWIEDQEVLVKDGKIKEYRIKMKVTFVLKD